MTNTSLKLSGKIEADTAAILTAIANVSENCGIPFVIIGAIARDIHLHHIHGLDLKRKTRDVDIAIIIESWERYDILITALTETGSFSKAKIKHRLMFADKIPVDIVPFGDIAKDHTISWPPENETEMKVIGHAEAYEHALMIQISEDINPIRLVTLPNLVALKLIAWKDRRHDTTKDAVDISIILSEYINAGNLERLYSDFEAALDSVGYDVDLAAAFMLGVDIRDCVNNSTMKSLMEILETETKGEESYRLAKNMNEGPELETTIAKLKQIKMGLKSK